jgi:hypothetical protein
VFNVKTALRNFFDAHVVVGFRKQYFSFKKVMGAVRQDPFDDGCSRAFGSKDHLSLVKALLLAS